MVRPMQRRSLQNLEESRGDAHAGNLHRLAIARQIHGDWIDGGDIAERPVARAPVQEILGLDYVGPAEGLAFPDHHQAVRRGEWERTQQDGVHHAENRGGGADTECEYGDGGDGEGRRFAQHAYGEPRVARHTFHRAPAPGFAGGFADLREVAEIAPRARRGPGRARGAVALPAPGESVILRRVPALRELSARTSSLPPTHGYNAGFMTFAMASTNWFQRDSSAASRFLPAAVRR